MMTPTTELPVTLDHDTVYLIQQLALSWGVSPTEALRRSVQLAVTNSDPPVLTPQAVIDYYRIHPLPRNWTRTLQLIEELRQQRHAEDELRMSK